MADLQSDYVKKLVLYNFRNYRLFEAEFSSSLVAIVGENGIGKTNLLEAVSFLSPGKGLRGAVLDDICYRETNSSGQFNKTSSWQISSYINSFNKGDFAIKIAGGYENNKFKKTISLEDKTIPQTNLLSYFNLNWVTPQMSNIFISGSSSRRKFFDRLIFNLDENHLKRLSHYEKLLKERNNLLKKGIKDNVWYKAIEAQLASIAVALGASRIEYIEKLNKSLSNNLAIYPSVKIELQDKLALMLQEKSALECEETLKKLYESSRYKDFILQTTSLKPHRSEIVILDLQKSVECSFNSTGEQKFILLAIAVAHANLIKSEKNKVPIMLLDEALTHLDEKNRHAVIQELIAFKTQIFITTTESSILEPFLKDIDVVKL